MSAKIRATEVPSDSEIHRRLPGAYFYDCYEVPMPAEDAGSSALAFALQTFLHAPGWVEFLMRLRNRLVRLVGLKDLGSFNDFDRLKPASSYQVGDRIGIFSLRYLSENEVILGDSDKHLDVQVSAYKSTQNGVSVFAVSTVVHVHNRLGKFYMFFVGPAHKVIAPATLRRKSL